MVLAPILILPLIFLTLLVYHHIKRPRLNLPPGPSPWPVVGNLYGLKPVLCRCFHEWAQTHGPIISVWLGSHLHVIVSSSKLAKQVLKDNDHELSSRYRIKSQAKFTNDGMDLTWADYGPHYVKVRKICTSQLFNTKKIEALRTIREEEIAAMIKSIYNECNTNPIGNNGEGMITMRSYLSKAALNHITRLTFGKRFLSSKGKLDRQGQEFMDILHEMRTIKRLNIVVECFPWLQWMFLPYDESFDKHKDRLYNFAKEIIEEEDYERNFVVSLLSSKDKYDLSEETMVGLLWDMIIAGMDTVAIAVEWAMAELVRHPRIQQTAQQELDRVIGPRRIITEEDFTNLPYLQAIVKESLRLHPPTPLMLPHRATSDVEIGDFDVPRGTIVNVNVWAVARDPDTWPGPLEFRPERFLEEGDVDVKGHDFRLLPFGAGRRVCPGAQLGISFVTLMLGRVLHHFDWALPSGVNPSEVDMVEAPGVVTYMAAPLQVVARPRLQANFCLHDN